VDDVGMWTHQTQRLVPRPVAEVGADIARIVDGTWRPIAAVTTTEHHGRRSDWVTVAPHSDEVDIVLTWTLTDLDDSTYVVLTLDEFNLGPDPMDGLEEILDVLASMSHRAAP
jgi:hypothetical protein